MRQAVHAEWTKLRTLASTGWLLFAIVALTVLTAAATTAPVDTSHCPSTGCFEDTTKLSLGGVRLSQVAVVVFAALMIGNEYGTRMIQITLAATPRRPRVLAAKALVLTVAVLVTGSLSVLGSLAVGGAILNHNGFDGYGGPMWQAGFGTVLYLVLVGLLTLGVGTALRDTAGAITAMLVLLFLVPVITGLVHDPDWREWLDRLSPMQAGLAIQNTMGLDRLPIGPWAGMGVLTAWAAAAIILGGSVLVTRDA
jgi:ABC-2 type transport system permease protein